MPRALLTTLLAAIIGLALLAKKLGVAYPVVFVIGGAVLGAIPARRRIALAPDLVFLLFLPPLIFGDGWTTDVRTFLRAIDGRSCCWRSAWCSSPRSCVAYAAHALLGFPLALGFVLGAILSPTDAVATDAIAEEARSAAPAGGDHQRRIARQRRARGLVVVRVRGQRRPHRDFSLRQAVLQFVYVVVVGLAVGSAAARSSRDSRAGFGAAVCPMNSSRFRSRSSRRSRSMCLPTHCTHRACLAALSGGMMLSQKSSKIFESGKPHRRERGMESAVLHLQRRGVRADRPAVAVDRLRRSPCTRPRSWRRWSLGIAAVVILARYVWVFVGSRRAIRSFGEPKQLEGPRPPWQVTFILGRPGCAASFRWRQHWRCRWSFRTAT